MYHLGKVQLVYSPKSKNIVSNDTSVQVAVKMWDENLMNGDVEASLAEKIKAGDIVLVDYSPLPSTPAPRVTVTKILKGEEGKRAWKLFEEYYDKRKQPQNTKIAPVPFPNQQII